MGQMFAVHDSHGFLCLVLGAEFNHFLALGQIIVPVCPDFSQEPAVRIICNQRGILFTKVFKIGGQFIQFRIYQVHFLCILGYDMLVFLDTYIGDSGVDFFCNKG